MDAKKEAILQHLHKKFPDEKIYREEFTRKNITTSIDYNVRKIAKDSNMTVTAWLRENGFDFRETGYIESDMKSGDNPVKGENAVELAENIIKRYPLIGIFTPDEKQNEMLFTHAQKTVRKMIAGNVRIAPEDELVLTVATVQLIKNRKPEKNDDESGARTFWKYIYLQYGFQAEDHENAQTRVYNGFRTAIKNTLERYKRYFAPEGTMKYYTSLQLHALSPKQSFMNLFNVLFSFYVENLDFQYMPEDVSFKTLTKGMQARWNSDVQTEEGLKLRADAVMSGLKTMFLERPGYMAVFCDDIVKKIDAMLRGENFMPEDYPDELLNEWYREKSSSERVRLQGEKKHHRTEFVATSEAKIFIRYAMEKEQVGLFLPRIRLEKTDEERPKFLLFQEQADGGEGKEAIFSCVLSVTGNDLSLTTRERFVPLEDTDLDFSQPFRLRGEIHYGGEAIYSSGNKLNRRWICFSADGNEIEHAPQSGMIYVLGNEKNDFTFSNEEEIYQENHSGQLFRINLNAVASIAVDGTEIFADEQQTGKIRAYPSIHPVKGAVIESAGESYHIFADRFELSVELPEDKNVLQYRIKTDGELIKPTAEENNGRTKKITVAPGDNALHTVTVIDIVQGLVQYEYRYCVLHGFTITTEKKYYTASETCAFLQIEADEKTLREEVLIEQDSHSALLPAAIAGHDIRVEIPTVQCIINGENGFELPQDIWWKDLSKGTFASICVPEGYQAYLMIGITEIGQNAEGMYEVGNTVYSGKHFEAEEPLWIRLITKDGANDRLLLTNIHFQESFCEAPMEVEDEALFWKPEEKFCGEANAEFEITIRGKRIFKLTLTDKNEETPVIEILPHGAYHYTVTEKIKGSIFTAGREKIIYESEFIIGSRNEFLYEGKEFCLTKAIYWNLKTDAMDEAVMNATAGIVTNPEYLGMSIPAGESFEMPEYTATLMFETKTGRRIAFNADECNEKFEQINPVHIWVVNGRSIIMHTATDDALYLDIQYRSLVNENPDKTMTRKAQEIRLQTPDYYEYELRGAENV